MSRWGRDDLEEVRELLRAEARKVAPASSDLGSAEFGRIYWGIARTVLHRAAGERLCARASYLDYKGDFHHARAEAILSALRETYAQWFAEALESAAIEVADREAKLAGEGGRP